MATKFCDQLKSARKKAGISQPVAASRIGVNVGTFRNWEQDRQTPMPPMQDLALARISQEEAPPSSPPPPTDFHDLYRTAFEMLHADPAKPLSEIRRFLSREFPQDYPEASRRAIEP